MVNQNTYDDIAQGKVKKNLLTTDNLQQQQQNYFLVIRISVGGLLIKFS